MRLIIFGFFGFISLCAAASAAVKTPMIPDDTARDMYRLQIFGSCMATVANGDEEIPPLERFPTCECVADRLIQGRSEFPAFPGPEAKDISEPLAQCRSGGTIPPQLVAPTDPLDMNVVTAADGPPPVAVSRPVPPAGFDLIAWLDRSGIPRWAWPLLVIPAILVLWKLKNGSGNRHLVAPPPSMRSASRPGSDERRG